MPLTPFQSKLAKLLSGNRTEDSYLAGGAAIHFEPNSKRYSLDLDYFHDSEKRVAEAYDLDQKLLKKNSYLCEVELNQPGYIKAIVSKDGGATKVEWAQDSSWRFMPVVKDKDLGFRLHPVDLATNKLLALVGRDEPRDFLDVDIACEEVLGLGGLIWAACGKDPGFNPMSLLELLKRRGKYRPEDFKRLMLTEEIDLVDLKERWLERLKNAEAFISHADPESVGCLFYDSKSKKFIEPDFSQNVKDVISHYGRPGGVLPKVL